MEQRIFRARLGNSQKCQTNPTIYEPGNGSRSPSFRRWAAALFLLGCALLNNGCADGPFLPQPENLPADQSAPSDDTPQPLQPPSDL